MNDIKVCMRGMQDNKTEYIKNIMLGLETLECGEFKVVVINKGRDFKWEYNACNSSDARFDESILIVIDDAVVYADHNFNLCHANILKSDNEYCRAVREFIEHNF